MAVSKLSELEVDGMITETVKLFLDEITEILRRKDENKRRILPESYSASASGVSSL